MITPLEKYLNHYAHRFAFPMEDIFCDKIVVLPAFGEEIKDVLAVLETLKTAAEQTQEEVLAILVINQRKHATEEYKEINKNVLCYFQAEEKSYSLQKNPFLSILVLNYTFAEKEFSDKEGVGLARKIGCDLASLLYFKGAVKSPWIYTTDIDAKVAPDYFAHEQLQPDTALKLFSFRHSFDQEDGDALLLYDIWLRYYTLSLKKAASPFSYSTLGSTFCIHTEAYAKVRGFPNRLAAEDFHLASKLSKVGKIVPSQLSPLVLSGRKSDRVPFGTGVGTHKYTMSLNENKQICFINPQCFILLQKFQRAATHYLENPASEIILIPQEIEKELCLSEILQTAIATRTNIKDRLKHFWTTFDALKTLRFIHLAERFYYPKVSYESALFLLNSKFDATTKSLLEISKQMGFEEDGFYSC